MLRREMKNAWLSLAIIAATWSTGWAQSGAPVTVRSGEHASFSRLVFELGETTEWGLGRIDDGYTLTFGAELDGLDLSGVYRLIPKTRLTSIAIADGADNTVALGVADDHHVTVLEIAPGRLVVDVVVGPPPQITAVLPVDESPEPAPQISVLKPPSLTSERSANLQSVAATSPPTSTRLPPATQVETNTLFPDTRVLSAQNRLVEQLGRAMTLGVINTNTEPSQKPTRALPRAVNAPNSVVGHADQAKDGTADNFETVVLPHPLNNILDHLNMDATTIYDQPNGNRADPTMVLVDPPDDCLPDAVFQLGRSEYGPETTEEIGVLRSALAQEFDEIDPDTFEQLVRLYIRTGFGVEAKALLESFPALLEHTDVLRDLASLVETGAPLDNSILARQSHCPGVSSLWSILARTSIPAGEPLDSRKLGDDFGAMPIDLRRLIGPALATRLLESGFVSEALQIAKLVARAAGDPGPEFALLDARLRLALGKRTAARAAMTDLVVTNQPNADEVLKYLFADYFEVGDQIPEFLIDEIAIRAFQARYSAVGAELRVLEIRARARSGAQGKAFDTLTDEAILTTLTPAVATSLAAEIFLSFSDEVEGMTEFVQTFFRYRFLLSDQPEMAAARHHIASLLLDAGLPQEALKQIELMAAEPDHLLRAEIYLAMERPDLALSEVRYLTSPTASKIKFRAFSALEQYQRALEYAAAEVPVSARLDAAWRGAEWMMISQYDRTIRREAANYILAETVDTADAAATRTSLEMHPAIPSEVSLNGLDGLLTQSQDMRARLGDLLQYHPSP